MLRTDVRVVRLMLTGQVRNDFGDAAATDAD